ncbi:MAG: hypothetical protein EOP45_00310 [Sphingobacteriaceae bacterium]|nr:MAG: hypothetical protein EOP45_00310 [Sphingobacteriaceae bacterium]
MASEQIWIDSHNPEYNVFPMAYSTLGETEQSKHKIKKGMTGKSRSQKVRDAMSVRQTDSGNTFYGKFNTDQYKALLHAAVLARDIIPKPGCSV